MTVTHVGSSKKYAAGWETIFSGAGAARRATSTVKPTAAKKKAVGAKPARRTKTATRRPAKKK